MYKVLTSVLYAAILSLPLLLSACHDDELTVEPAPVDILSHFSAEGKAWLMLNLSLPEDDGATRAVTFSDGTEQEHAIRTLTLVLFHGTGSEDQMQVASTYQLDYAAEADGHAQVTHHSLHTLQISNDNILSGDRLAFLAIANASLSISAGQTFATLKALTSSITTDFSGTSYFVMASSPVASANDGTGTVTTLVGISADNLNAGGDFYTTSVTGQDIIFQPPTTTLSEEGTSASSSFSRLVGDASERCGDTVGGDLQSPTRSAVVTYDGTSTATIDDYLRTWLWQTNSDLRQWVNTYAAGEPGHISIAVTTPAGGGTATATVTQTAQPNGTTGATAFAALHLDNYISDNISLTFYDDGYCYYRVPIRHFDNTQTPWSSIPSMTNNTTAWVYGDGTACDESKYLGRYGMVRNNWYDISIHSVTHVGSPVIPPLTTNADDRVEQLLNASLSISGWTTNNRDL